MIKNKIKKLILARLAENFSNEAAVNESGFSVSQPPEGIQSDYAINLPMIYARKNGLPLEEALKKILPAISATEGLMDFFAIGGFLNFKVTDDFLSSCLLEILLSKNGEIYRLKENENKRVLVEFVSSNPTGPLHIGHARCAAIGDSVARIYEALGFGEVQREYYVNDIGNQVRVLENSVRARIREIEGLPCEFPENGYRGGYIYDIAREAIKNFGSAVDTADVGKYAVSKMIETTRGDLENFGVRMDNYFSESSLADKTEELMKWLLEKKLAYYEDGALWFGSSSVMKNPDDKDRVLKKRTGEYTYFATDIAYHRDKYERGYDEIINVWGADHHGYVPRIKAAVRALGYDDSKLKIVLYQLVSLRRGPCRIAMSTRSGEFVTLKEVLDEVGKDATRFFLLMRAPDSSVDFDLELAKKQSSENPVYYVQYAHARICSVFQEARRQGLTARSSSENFILSDETSSDTFEKNELFTLLKLLKEPPERELMKVVSSFGDVLILSKKDSSAHHITTYLMDVARKLHNFYERCRVLSPESRDITFARLALLRATRKTIREGLSVIGVSAPSKM